MPPGVWQKRCSGPLDLHRGGEPGLIQYPASAHCFVRYTLSERATRKNRTTRATVRPSRITRRKSRCPPKHVRLSQEAEPCLIDLGACGPHSATGATFGRKTRMFLATLNPDCRRVPVRSSASSAASMIGP